MTDSDNTLAEGQSPETLQSLAQQFVAPPDAYKPHAWWHWLGSNFSKSGITQDLRAMKESGIGGVVIFNAPNWLDPAKNPQPHQTYRSEAYWDAVNHAMVEAKRLNMTIGMHNSPGWSTTGGPWITPDQGMQGIIYSKTSTEGQQQVKINLPKPAFPNNPKANEVTEKYYRDVAVIAVPVKDTRIDAVVDISQYMNTVGNLDWQAPTGEWWIYRMGYAPTMVFTHPNPEDLDGKSLEVDKFDRKANINHWNNVLNPLKERFGEYIGSTFKYIWIDSYEAGEQNWTPNFRADFIRMKGYDPIPQLALADARGDSILDEQGHGFRDPGENAATETTRFLQDYMSVTRRLFMDGFRVAKEMVNAAGFKLSWEPYVSWGSDIFDMKEGAMLADLPVTEFWIHDQRPLGGDAMIKGATAGNRRIVGAEAFTGMEYTCRFNETPKMLKHSADMGYNYGINLLFLHTWPHQPFDDRYQPGFAFAHYGTHFSRNQTWFEPGKAFFTYLARCQMLLQQGDFISRSKDILQRSTPDAEIFFVCHTDSAGEISITFPVNKRTPELWDAYAGTIKTTNQWTEKGDSTVVTLKMEKDESVFVIFPTRETNYAKLPERNIRKETLVELTGKWTVFFQPKIGDKPFKQNFSVLTDFSKHNNAAIQYFSGTAIYEKTIRIRAADLDANKRISLDLGKLYDIAELEVNGQRVGVLWHPPYCSDITSFLKTGANTLRIHVTNNWANRLIGDEQYPEDFEWTDKNQGLRAMTGLPEWFINNQPRPVKERKTFVPWYYFKKDSPLYPAGLLGPVKLIKQDVM
jgi:hypothetical protein